VWLSSQEGGVVNIGDMSSPRWATGSGELDALRAENAKLRAKLAMPCGSCHPCTQWANQTWVNAGLPLPHVSDWQEMEAERDALRAQLDAMTEEFAPPFDDIADLHAAGIHNVTLVKRLVGPWVEVKDGDNHE
jgi:hypothetical protein